MLRVGFYQFRPLFGKVARNREKILQTLDQVEADIMVLPELAFTGYYFADQKELAKVAEDPSDSPTLNALDDLCRRKQMVVVSGFAEKKEEFMKIELEYEKELKKFSGFIEKLREKLAKIEHYRQLVFTKVAANLQTETSRDYLSYLWWVIEPILHMLVYYLVFSFLLSRGTEDYVVFLLTGLIPFFWRSICYSGKSQIIQLLLLHIKKNFFSSINYIPRYPCQLGYMDTIALV